MEGVFTDDAKSNSMEFWKPAYLRFGLVSIEKEGSSNATTGGIQIIKKRLFDWLHTLVYSIQQETDQKRVVMFVVSPIVNKNLVHTPRMHAVTPLCHPFSFEWWAFRRRAKRMMGVKATDPIAAGLWRPTPP